MPKKKELVIGFYIKVYNCNYSLTHYEYTVWSINRTEKKVVRLRATLKGKEGNIVALTGMPRQAYTNRHWAFKDTKQAVETISKRHTKHCTPNLIRVHL